VGFPLFKRSADWTPSYDSASALRVSRAI
jgi:hypothetical protein